MRLTGTGTLTRDRLRKRSRSRNLLTRLLEEVFLKELHERGDLPDEAYYPERVGISCEEGSLPDIGPRARYLRFGESGRACKNHWQDIPDKSRVTFELRVEPYGNRIGGKITKVLLLEVEA